MRTGWIFMAILAITRSAAAADVTVYVTSDRGPLNYWTKTIANSIFQKAGVAIDWRSRPPVTGAPGTWLRIELAEHTPDELLPGALAVSYPYAGCAKGVTVFFDRIRGMARGLEHESALLAYVLVHEIAHVIQGVDRHSDAGVMKARWSAADRDAIFERRLGFLEDDVLMMQQGLAGGRPFHSATLIGRSESGTAVHPE